MLVAREAECSKQGVEPINSTDLMEQERTQLLEQTINIGIHRMVVTAPSLKIPAETLAMGVNAKNIKTLSTAAIDNLLRNGSIKGEAADWLLYLKDDLKSLYSLKAVSEAAQMLADDRFLGKDAYQDLLKSAFVHPDKVKTGLGIKSIRLPGHSESNATFVADALYKFIKDLAADEADLKKFFAEPISAIFYGTESNTDKSRPDVIVASQMVFSKLLAEDEQRYRPIIEIMKHALPKPMTFACVGGVLCMDSAIEKILAREVLGKKVSCLVITADTAVYESKKAPNADLTQGAMATLSWFTKEPRLARFGVIDEAYTEAMPDFTKFGEDSPYVHGTLSLVEYVYAIAKSEGSKRGKELIKRIMDDKLDFELSHTPYTNQPINRATVGFVEILRNYDKRLFEEIQARIGREPLPEGIENPIQLFDRILKGFNKDTSKKILTEQEIIHQIEHHPVITQYLTWLSVIKKQPEFLEFLDKMRYHDWLWLSKETGNSYTSAIFAGIASMISTHINVMNDFATGGGLKNAITEGVRRNFNRIKDKLIGKGRGYGSGASANSFDIQIVASCKPHDNYLSIDIDKNVVNVSDESTFGRVQELLLSGDAKRLISNDGLIEKDLALLRMGNDRLPDGFRIIGRSEDGSGRYAYVKDGMVLEIAPRY